MNVVTQRLGSDSGKISTSLPPGLLEPGSGEVLSTEVPKPRQSHDLRDILEDTIWLSVSRFECRERPDRDLSLTVVSVAGGAGGGGAVPRTSP